MRISHGALAATLLVAGCRPSLEGELQASGAFSSLQIFEAEGAPWAGALSGSQLTLLSLSDGGRCDVGSFQRFAPARATLTAIVTWSSGTEGCGELGFVDPHCGALMEPIACVAEP